MGKLILVGLIVVGLVVRLWGLGSRPLGFTPDEAAFGYNAYSLAQTGRDEWGISWWQLAFTNLKSFGDYKLPLYAFLTVPSVTIFGLTEFATRLPSAIFGILAIPAIYVAVRKLFPKLPTAAMWASLFVALSPWAIGLSRGAFEANLIVCLLPLLLASFATRLYLISFLLSVISMYSYHTARFYVPLLLIVLVVYYRPAIHKLLVFALLPAIFFLTSSARIADVGIFSPTDNWAAVADSRFVARAAGLPDIFARIVSNKLTYVTSTGFTNYLTYLSPLALFATGAGEATYGLIPGTPLLLAVHLVAMLAFFLWAARSSSKTGLVVLSLILLAPLPASFAKGSGFAGNRAANLIPLFALAGGVGISYLSSHKLRLALVVLAIVQFSFFTESYVYHGPQTTPQSMNYGWSELINRITNIEKQYPEVVFSRSLSEPHIFVAFYKQLPPTMYHQATTTWPNFASLGMSFLDQYDGYTIGKYTFGDLHLDLPRAHPVLLIGKSTDFSPQYPEYFHITYPNGQTAIKVAELK